MDLNFMVLNKRIKSITSRYIVIPAQAGIHSNGNYCGFRIKCGMTEPFEKRVMETKTNTFVSRV